MGSYGRLAARALDTDVPVMVKLAELSKSAKDAVPLGQGAVYWQPPEQALDRVKHVALEISTSRYGTHEGLPELREALLHKLSQENKLSKSSVMVTAGSNQGFLNLVLSLCDVADSVVLFAPYFFNAYMSFKMTGINNILVGPSDPMTLLPDAGNPSGICIPEPLLKIAYSLEADGLLTQLLKVQDNVAICTSMISQHVALYCLESGREWVQSKVKSLERNKELLRDALSPLGEEAVKGGEGAIYLWAKLPETCLDDIEVVCWFARRHGLLLLPGSACGTSGYVRITFGMLREEECEVAAKRLRNGVEELIRDGTVE
ncbi:aromatic aminotransferase ISS1-like isoform X7 [Rhododendron vialii]|uniref:aromatic aminotransferase ISS1-like isoform X7 n=1 Tax=Rhododendron vialii TaxID=182163 RepID=UPI00265E263F|nr:aromatic aminotransferase ISS1-like isoform X7 [Rhododendron vialii]